MRKVPKGSEIFMNLHVNRTPAPVDESRRSVTCRAAAAAVKHGEGAEQDRFQGAAGRELGSFEPRRWLVRDDRTGRESFDAHAIPALAFGGGYRGCIGECPPVLPFLNSIRDNHTWTSPLTSALPRF